MKLFLLLFLCLPAMALEIHEPSARYLIHILDYIATDYAGAAGGGKIISQSEYAEQNEFVQEAISIEKQLPELAKSPTIAAGMQDLRGLIQKKVDADEVKKLARHIESEVIQISRVEVAPGRWPDRRAGRVSFEQSCVRCHGNFGYGDGPSGKGLKVPPANLHDAKMAAFTPFQIFNIVRLGVPGTEMPSFEGFSDAEIWNLAFYVESLRYDVAAGEKIAPPPGPIPELTLKETATVSDEELLKKMSGTDAEKRDSIARLRLFSPAGAPTLQVAKDKLIAAVGLLKAGNRSDAKKEAVLAYLEGVEPVEPGLRTKDAALTTQLEEKMARARSAIDAGDIALAQTAVDSAFETLATAEEVLSEKTSSAWLTFTVAAGIFLREGFEAALLIITLLGVIRSIGTRRAALYVHGGWGLALLVGVICWMFSGWVMQMSGAGREMMEGSISIFAVVVLLYFGFWLHRKTEIGKWKAFIGEMVKNALDRKKLIGLGGIAFMAVFRESFETVLFLRALALESGNQYGGAMLAGVIFSLIIVILLAAAIVRYSAKLPLRQLFAVSSFIMIVLSFILVGKAFHSFQEVGLVSATSLPVMPRSDLMGLYPTYETILPQLIVLALSAAFWAHGRRHSARPASLSNG